MKHATTADELRYIAQTMRNRFGQNPDSDVMDRAAKELEQKDEQLAQPKTAKKPGRPKKDTTAQ